MEEGGGGYLAWNWDSSIWGADVLLAQMTNDPNYGSEVCPATLVDAPNIPSHALCSRQVQSNRWSPSPSMHSARQGTCVPYIKTPRSPVAIHILRHLQALHDMTSTGPQTIHNVPSIRTGATLHGVVDYGRQWCCLHTWRPSVGQCLGTPALHHQRRHDRIGLLQECGRYALHCLTSPRPLHRCHQ